MSENNPTAPENTDSTPQGSPVQTQDQTPPAPVQAPAPPPATTVVVNGTRTEREIELERQLAERDEKLTAAERAKRETEFKAAELERTVQDLKKIPAAANAPKPKRQKHWSDPVFE